jgi:hypothetical protein
MQAPLRYWKVLFFMAATLTSTLAGAYLHHNASTGVDYKSLLADKLDIRVFSGTQNGRMAVTVNVTRSNGPGIWTADVYVTAPTGTPILVTSNSKKIPYGGVPESTEPSYKGPAYKKPFDSDWHLTSVFYTVFPTPDDAAVTPDGLLIGSFDISSSVSNLEHGIFSAVLPSIAQDEKGSQNFPALASSRTSGLTKPSDEILGGTDALGRQTFDGSPDVYQVWWEPQTLESKVRLGNATATLRSADIQVNYPPFSGVIDQNLQWQGSYGLSPMLLTVDRTEQEGRSRNEFLAGIALATGISALFALVQEIRSQPTTKVATPSRQLATSHTSTPTSGGLVRLALFAAGLLVLQTIVRRLRK